VAVSNTIRMKEPMMSKRVVLTVLAAALVAGGGCYEGETTFPRQPLARVLLTDAPFPYDSVESVNVFVVRVEASTDWVGPDSGEWVLIAEPKQSFNLLTLERGTTAFLGEKELPAGQYHMIRMTIDTSLSSIVWGSGTERIVNWQNHWQSNEMPLYASVEYPVDVPPEGADIVIDFDLGRSFLYDFYGSGEFTFIPQLRAINSAATGTIAGIVTTDHTGDTRPLRNASVTVVFDGPCTCDPPSTRVVATGRSDDTGYYKVAFVRAGMYAVRIEPPSPSLEPVVTQNVQITAGATTTLSVTLQQADFGGAFISITGPASVGIGRTIMLVATVSDGNGDPVPPRSITWTSGTGIATVTGTDDTAYVTGHQAGGTWITASAADARSASHWIDVVASTAPVATVTVVPENADVTVGDSVLFAAELRDTAGTLLTNRPVSWFTTDTTVIAVYPFGEQALVQARAAGTAILRATSEGKAGQATVTVP
jgi:hypothetical protein